MAGTLYSYYGASSTTASGTYSLGTNKECSNLYNVDWTNEVNCTGGAVSLTSARGEEQLGRPGVYNFWNTIYYSFSVNGAGPFSATLSFSYYAGGTISSDSFNISGVCYVTINDNISITSRAEVYTNETKTININVNPSILLAYVKSTSNNYVSATTYNGTNKTLSVTAGNTGDVSTTITLQTIPPNQYYILSNNDTAQIKINVLTQYIYYNTTTTISGSNSVYVDATTTLSVSVKTTGGSSISASPISWSSSNENIATVSSSGVVTGKASGTVTITCNFNGKTSGNNVYYSSSGTHKITIYKYTPTISLSAGSSSIYVGKTTSISRSINYGLSLSSFSITSGSSYGTLSGTTLTGKAQGTVTITASYGGNYKYNAVSKSITISVVKYSTTVAVSPPSQTIAYGQSITFTGTVKVSVDGSTLSTSNKQWWPSSYSIVSHSGVSTFNGIYPGTVTITCAFNGDTTYAASSGNATLTISKATPSIILNYNNNITKTYGDSAFSVSVTTNSSGGTVRFYSSNTSVATVAQQSNSGATVTIKGAGTAQLYVTVDSTVYYNSATSNKITLTVNKASASVTINSGSSITKTYGNGAFNVSITYNKSGGTIYWSTSNSKISISPTSGNTTTVTINQAGDVYLYAYSAATSNYNQSSTASILIRINKASASVTINYGNNITKTYGNSAFNVSITYNQSGGTIYWYTSNSNISISTTSGNTTTVTINQAGDVYLYAYAAATTNYNQSSTASILIRINKADPILYFTNLPYDVYGKDGSYILTYYKSPISLTHTITLGTNGANASLNGVTITPSIPGTTYVNINISSSTNYNAASHSTYIKFNTYTPVISLSPSGTKNYTYGTSPFNVTVSGVPSGVTNNFTNSNSNVISLSSSSGTSTNVTIKQSGTAKITAQTAATTWYTKSNTVALTLNVSNSNVNTYLGPYGTSIYVGATKQLTVNVIAVTGNYTISTSPSSVSWEPASSQNSGIIVDGNGLLTGLHAGTYTVTARYAGFTNKYNSSTSTLSITINKAPTITTLHYPENTTSKTTVYYEQGPYSFTNVVISDVTGQGVSTSNSNLSWSSSNSNVVSISGGTFTIKKAGTVTITGQYPGNSDYQASSDTHEIEVKPAPTTTTVKGPGGSSSISIKVDQTLTNALTITVTSNISGKTLSWSSIGGAIVANGVFDYNASANTITGLTPGTGTITRTPVLDSNYYATSSNSISVTVEKSNTSTTITYNNSTNNITKQYGEGPFTLGISVINTSSGKNNVISTSNASAYWKSSNTGVASINTGTFTIVNVGETTFNAYFLATTKYNASGWSNGIKLTVNKGNTTTTLGYIGNSRNRTFDDKTITLTQVTINNHNGSGVTTSVSNSVIHWVSSDTSVASTPVNGVSNILKAGNVTFTGYYLGDSKHNAAPMSAGIPFSISETSTTISILYNDQSSNSVNIPFYNTGSNTFGLQTKITSNYTQLEIASQYRPDSSITWTSSNTSVATVSSTGNTVTVTIKSVGNTVISAKYNGHSGHYSPSGNTDTITINIESSPMIMAVYCNDEPGYDFVFYTDDNDPTLTVVTSPDSSLANSCTWTSSNTSVATVTSGAASSKTLTIKNPGRTTITCTYPGGNGYTSNSKTINILIKKTSNLRIANWKYIYDNFSVGPNTILCPTYSAINAYHPEPLSVSTSMFNYTSNQLVCEDHLYVSPIRSFTPTITNGIVNNSNYNYFLDYHIYDESIMIEELSYPNSTTDEIIDALDRLVITHQVIEDIKYGLGGLHVGGYAICVYATGCKIYVNNFSVNVINPTGYGHNSSASSSSWNKVTITESSGIQTDYLYIYGFPLYEDNMIHSLIDIQGTISFSTYP